ncbi:NYN domain-containing protein [Stieleria sp. JC731]|uniref:NYN domain-containing protein n=1 Tax=Pirellulaceae TaxID=2691357 RepID=UPI001E439483|nr:NYN domain-containing protein [Stieleria sp. JC731]MCC9599762.1 NYN domain-containing protein [Stieleria sp. JC731]
MSLLLLIDGYNITQPIRTKASDPRWLEKNRRVLLRDLVKYLDDETRHRTCVVFDAANPPKDRASEYQHHGIKVRFAVGYPTADDLLEELIRGHHTPKKLMVVSSDHRVQIAASRRSAAFRDSEPWMDALTDGTIILADGEYYCVEGSSNPGSSKALSEKSKGQGGASAAPKRSGQIDSGPNRRQASLKPRQPLQEISLSDPELEELLATDRLLKQKAPKTKPRPLPESSGKSSKTPPPKVPRTGKTKPTEPPAKKANSKTPDSKSQQGRVGKPRIEDSDEVNDWMREFGFEPE